MLKNEEEPALVIESCTGVPETDIEEERSDPEPAIIAISFDGIFLLSGWNLSVQNFHSFEVVTKWTVASNPDLFAFSVHDQLLFQKNHLNFPMYCMATAMIF